MNIVFLMAGLGTRMGENTRPKPLLSVAGKPMIQAAVESLGLNGHHIFISRKYEDESLNSEVAKVIKNIGVSSFRIIELDHLTQGPAESALAAKEFINNQEDLIVTNCDQVLNWDASKFQNFLSTTDKDGIVITYPAVTEKNSYIKLDDNGNGLEIAEKKIISKHSLNGVHWWKKGSDFIHSVELTIKKNIRVNNEFYIAPTYNELISAGKKIGIYPLQENEHFPVGTKEDLEIYLRKKYGNS